MLTGLYVITSAGVRLFSGWTNRKLWNVLTNVLTRNDFDLVRLLCDTLAGVFTLVATVVVTLLPCCSQMVRTCLVSVSCLVGGARDYVGNVVPVVVMV